jgi:hypothetical protein
MAAAARVGDPTNHGGVVVGPGEPTVLIGGMPAAVMGDNQSCPMVSAGHPPTSPFITPKLSEINSKVLAECCKYLFFIDIFSKCITLSPFRNSKYFGILSVSPFTFF